MKEATNFGTKKMWYVVDRDGWGKLYQSKPKRQGNIWVSATDEPEPKQDALLLPDEAKKLGKTWKDEPTEVEIMYDMTITLKKEQ